MLEPRDAWQRLLPHTAPLGEEEVPRRRAAGRVLTRPVAATVDVPAADVSAMDGYALAGPLPASRELPLAGRVLAGDPPGRELAPGTTLAIMTGAPVPAAADRVVPVELTEARGERILFREDTGPGAHVRRRGEIVGRGATVLPAGTLLTPAGLSLLATHGHGGVTVHRAPRVAILPTGDEVVPPESEPAPGQLRDSHSDFLAAAVAGLGLAAEPLPVAPDEPGELSRRLAAALEVADVLLVTGGVSMGEHDLVEGALAQAGYETLFDQVAIQPGKPLVAAVPQGGRERLGSPRTDPETCLSEASFEGPPAGDPRRSVAISGRGSRAGLVFGLPGNPGSVMVGFWLFVRPALRRLLGVDDGFWQGALPGILAAPLPGAKDRERFFSASVAFGERRLTVTPHVPQGSHDLAAYGLGTALVRVAAGASPAPVGSPCEVLPLADWRQG